jgi:L-aspartate oxidase
MTAIRWIEDLGILFDRCDGKWALHREAAHQCARVLHIGGDATGGSLTEAMLRTAQALPNVEFRVGCSALGLRPGERGISGVVAIDEQRKPFVIEARDTVLATGGLGQLYSHTTNPRSACGDGLAMALDAGAWCAQLEFVQFHPTALASETDPLPLITEAVRGAGARLVDDSGERFMTRIDTRAELAPRDVVARAVWNRARAGRRVYLDVTSPLREDSTSFPALRALCAARGIDPAREPIPVVPAAHYHMGGVVVDTHGRSSLEHLWACGEVACTGVHGANRLASNSLLEAVVFGRRLGSALSTRRRRSLQPRAGSAERVRLAWVADEPDASVWAALRRLMWDYLGIERDAQGLQMAQAQLAALTRRLPPEQLVLRGRAKLASAIADAALARRASIGAHCRLA